MEVEWEVQVEVEVEDSQVHKREDFQVHKRDDSQVHKRVPCHFPIEVWNHPTWFNPTGQILTPGYGKLKGPKPLDWRAITLDCKPTQDPSSKPLKAARLRVQQHCAGVAHFVLCFHPDHHALPLWLTRFIQQLVCQIPAARGLKATSKWNLNGVFNRFRSTQGLGPWHAGRLALAPQSKDESQAKCFRKCPHKIGLAPGKACYQPPSASPASVEPQHRSIWQSLPRLEYSRRHGRRTPAWLDLGVLISKHWRCPHPKIEPKMCTRNAAPKKGTLSSSAASRPFVFTSLACMLR